MKNLFILFFLILSLTKVFDVRAEEQVDLNDRFGNFYENKFLLSDNMYGIIFNPTDLSYVSAQVGANDYCKKTLGNNYTSSFFLPIANHTMYFACTMKQKIDQYNLPPKEKICFNRWQYDLQSKFCLNLRDKLSPIVKEIELLEIDERQYQKIDFIVKIISTELFNKIKEYEKTPELHELQQLRIENNIAICKKYQFKEGSDIFNQCILKLIQFGSSL